MKAQRLLPDVQIAEDPLFEIANVCSKLAVSNRAPVVITKTVKTLAAFSGRSSVNRDDVLEAIELALPHRMRKKPFERPFLSREKLKELISESINRENLDAKTENQILRKTANLRRSFCLIRVLPST